MALEDVVRISLAGDNTDSLQPYETEIAWLAKAF
jgi:hypothetical protein